MSLRMALLALLEAKPMTGYELAKKFDVSVANVWHASHSQIYPELKKLEVEGLISVETVSRGKHAKKNTCRLTSDGCNVLQDWSNTILGVERIRSEVLLKSTYLEWSSFENASRQFRTVEADAERVIARWTAHTEALRNRDTELMRARVADKDDEIAEVIQAYKVHVYDLLIRQSQVQADWARAGLELVENLRARLGADESDTATVPTPSSTQPPEGVVADGKSQAAVLVTGKTEEPTMVPHHR